MYILSQRFPGISQFKSRIYIRESSLFVSHFSSLQGEGDCITDLDDRQPVLGLVQHVSDLGHWHLVVTLHSLCRRNLVMVQSPYQLFIKHLHPPPALVSTGSLLPLFLYSSSVTIIFYFAGYADLQRSKIRVWLTPCLQGTPLSHEGSLLCLVYLKYLETIQLLRTWPKLPNSTRSLL